MNKFFKKDYSKILRRESYYICVDNAMMKAIKEKINCTDKFLEKLREKTPFNFFINREVICRDGREDKEIYITKFWSHDTTGKLVNCSEYFHDEEIVFWGVSDFWDVDEDDNMQKEKGLFDSICLSMNQEEISFHVTGEKFYEDIGSLPTSVYDHWYNKLPEANILVFCLPHEEMDKYDIAHKELSCIDDFSYPIDDHRFASEYKGDRDLEKRYVSEGYPFGKGGKLIWSVTVYDYSGEFFKKNC